MTVTDMRSTKFELVEIDEGSGEARLHFHEGQQRTWDSEGRFVLMLSGTQGGKTSFGPWWLWREVQERGSGDYLAATTNFDMFKLKMLPELKKCFVDILGIGRYWPGIRVIELMDPGTGKFLAKQADDPMWGRVILRSAEAPGGMESATAKAAWLDEVGQDEWDVTIWEAILRRLSLAQGRVLGTTTVYNSGWLKSEWYDKFIEGDGLYDVIQFDSTVNPLFPKDEFDRAKATMPDWRFGMFYEGRFTKPQGLIYKDFTDGMLFDYVPGMFPVGHPYRYYLPVDFGGANTATLYIFEDVKETPSRFYIFEEHLEGGKAASDHVALARERMVQGARFTVMGGAKSEGQQRLDWGAAGMKVEEPRVYDVESGIDAVTELLKTDRIRVARKLAGLRHEFNTYKRKTLDDGTVLELIDDKAKFHRLDALRYFGVYIVKPKKRKVRSARRRA